MKHVDTPQSVCRFAVARRDITPPVGIYHRMWGAAAHDRSEGIHRPLTATAMVFAPATLGDAHARGAASAGSAGRQILIALDHCLLRPQEMRRFIERVCAAASVKEDELLVTFSHTHGAGLMETDRADLPGGEMIAPYLESMAMHAAEAVSEAAANLQEATITFTTGRCQLAAHRDLWDERLRAFVCGYHPGGPVDGAVLVGRVTGSEENHLATIVNYACHPTTLAWGNRLISPDYPGAMREVVEQATGAPCVFLQGACGDVGPVEGFVGDVEVADRNGRQLGFAALSALEAMPPSRTRFEYAGPVVSGATIGTWEHRPLDGGELAAKARWTLRRWTIDLAYRPGLPTADETRRKLADWTAKEQSARRAGHTAAAADARAMAERMTRQLTRLRQQPPGETFPYDVTLWRIGDAFWLAVAGEPYNLLQRALREKFPGVALVVIELAGGWGPSYLPPADVYGQDLYQQNIAIVAPGSLERVIDESARQIQAWLEMASAAP